MGCSLGLSPRSALNVLLFSWTLPRPPNTGLHPSGLPQCLAVILEVPSEGPGVCRSTDGAPMGCTSLFSCLFSCICNLCASLHLLARGPVPPEVRRTRTDGGELVQPPCTHRGHCVQFLSQGSALLQLLAACFSWGLIAGSTVGGSGSTEN